MPPLPTPEAWAQIRHEYENTRRSIEDICLAHGISANTLRRRVKAWGWTMRQPPVSDQGPPMRAETDFVADNAEPSPHIEQPDPQPASARLHGAAARVMRAIETTSAQLTAKPNHLRETEMAARALGSLTRTLRELNELLEQHPVKADDDPVPEDMNEFRRELARRLEDVIAKHEAQIPAKYEAAWSEFAAEAKET
jgi:transposase-like protein